jgi:membrane fusion protein (multidrug efflux system)
MKQISTLLLLLLTLTACGGSKDAENGKGDKKAWKKADAKSASAPSVAVPVQVKPVERQSISQHLETNGTLEAENEVDIVARTTGPVTEINTEEGRLVRTGQIIARIDEREARNQVAISTVARDEAKLAFDRAKSSWDDGLVSREAYDTALSRLNAAKAQLESDEIQLAYTEIKAPFNGLVVTRNIKLAQYVTPGATLFRISDFNPLLCRIEVPEKDFPRIRIGQPAHLRVEAFPGDRFSAAVARLRPTVDAATGTFTATLEVDGQGKLRPGMFASVYLQTDTHDNALVVPRGSLVLDSLGDTVYVKADDTAERREVRLGLRSEDTVEILEGLSEGDLLIVVGQDGLADGTPVSVFGEEPQKKTASDGGPGAGRGAGMGRAAGGEIPPHMAQRIKDATPDELEHIKQRMKERGLSDDRIAEIIKKFRGEGSS